jgi:hypothetical protein
MQLFLVKIIFLKKLLNTLKMTKPLLNCKETKVDVC